MFNRWVLYVNVTNISRQVVCDACSSIALAKEKYAESGGVYLCPNCRTEMYLDPFHLGSQTQV